MRTEKIEQRNGGLFGKSIHLQRSAINFFYKSISVVLAFFGIITLLFQNIVSGESSFIPPGIIIKNEGRDKYLSQERKNIEESLQELSTRGIVIIPTLKSVCFGKNDFKIEKDSIAEKVSIISGNMSSIPVNIISTHLNLAEREKSNGMKISVMLIDKNSCPENSKNLIPADFPGTPQSYQIYSTDNGGRRKYVLIGNDKEGLLYAAITFCKIVKAENSSFIFPEVTICDWPDTPYRCAGGLEWPFRRYFLWNAAKNTEEAKRYIDRMLEHKINMLWGVSSTDPYSAIGDPRFRTKAMREWLKEINNYASERGIHVILPQTFALGATELDKNKAEFKNCIEHRGGFFCWSNDELISRKAVELNNFLRETSYSAVFFHSIDTRNSRWQDRCEKCKERFGDDRFAGDANMVNTLYREIKKQNPEILMAFVPRPYFGNLCNPEEIIKKGEMKNADDMKRFSAMIPEDIWLCRRECSREDWLSWKKNMKQPLFLYQESKNSEITLTGRFLALNFNTPKTYFDSFGNDAFFYCASWPENDLTIVGAAEFAWNVNSPGAISYDIKSRETIENLWDPFGENKDKNPEIQNFIQRACLDLYGEKNGRLFVDSFISLIDANFIFDYKTTNSELKEYGVSITAQNKSKICGRIYRDASKAILNLEKVVADASGEYSGMTAVYYLSKLYPLQIGARALESASISELELKQNNITKAEELANSAIKEFRKDLSELEVKWRKIKNSSSLRPVPDFNAVKSSLITFESMLNLVKVKVDSRAQLLDKSVKPNIINDDKKKSEPVRVAVLDPRKDKGSAYGVDGIVKNLSGVVDIKVSSINTISAETLKQFDCLVFPDCKKFGASKVEMSDLRSFVIEHGGGIYFEHDSCGSDLFPFQTSIFPEIAEAGDKAGVSPSLPAYRREDRLVEVVSSLPGSQGNIKGIKFEHCYSDHYQLKQGERGRILAEDSRKKPVIVYGESGSGRVIFSGMITYDISDKELGQSIPGDERKLFLDSIYWLANKKGTEISFNNPVKKEEVMTDGTYSIITFTPYVVPCGKLNNSTLSVECLSGDGKTVLSQEHPVVKTGNIQSKWIAEEEIKIKVPECGSVKLILILRADEGIKEAAIILDDNKRK